MTENNAADAQVDDLTQQGSDVQAGEPQGSGADNGEPTAQDSQSSGEPSGEGLFDGMTPEQLHQSYKKLQSQWTKEHETLKKFESYGGAEKMLEVANHLANNESFQEWAKKEQQKEAGVDTSEMDESQLKAIEMVKKIVQAEVSPLFDQLQQTTINPMSQTLLAQRMADGMQGLDKAYGDIWRPFENEIKEKMKDLSPELIQNLDFKSMDKLFWSAVVDKNSIADVSNKLNQRNIENQKKKSTEEPTGRKDTQFKKAKSIDEAFQQAKRMAQ